jgi:ElaB/YqjD/DUF883 family membrane-anchored ribosome-binding protein
MTDPITTPDSLEPSTGFTAAPSVAQAANDLRAAAGDKAKELAQSIGTQAAAIKERAIESAQHLREAATEKADALRIAAAERAHRLQESAVEQWSHTCETGKDIQITAEDYIRQNPTKCVFGALGLGILIGLMVRR